VTKFELPQLPAVDFMESAQLRFYLQETSGEPADIDLLHSEVDNDFERLVSDYDDISYTDTGLNVITASDEAGRYYELDVTELVRADYLSDAAGPVTAFRLQIGDVAAGDSLATLSMPRDVSNQPQLVLNVVPEPSGLALAALALLAVRPHRRRTRTDPAEEIGL
jgi:hypothetical protein